MRKDCPEVGQVTRVGGGAGEVCEVPGVLEDGNEVHVVCVGGHAAWGMGCKGMVGHPVWGY